MAEKDMLSARDAAGPFLSIVIPAHNEERRLPPSIRAIYAFLARQAYAAEVVVVENGSTDRTLAVAQELARQHAGLRVLRADQRGKGLAVRQGMLAATGEYRFLCDADLSMPIEQIEKFLPPHMDCDVAIGTREGQGATVLGEPSYRRWIGRTFNLLVRTLVVPGLRDTQCGFKLFTARAAQSIFPLQRLTGLAFDVEVLFIARRLGFRIGSVPILWKADQDTRVRLMRDSVAMAADLFAVRWNSIRGRYPTRPQ